LNSSLEEFKRHSSSTVEIVDHKICLTADGHHAVLDKLDSLETRFDRLERSVEKISLELEAHRADTEAYHGIYKVKEKLAAEPRLTQSRKGAKQDFLCNLAA